MQKKLIALAVAGLMAAPVFAQSNVTIYGRVDTGVVNYGGGDADSKTEMPSYFQAPSRLGIKGSEDLGNGLKVGFDFQTRLNFDNNTQLTQASSGSRRDAFLYLAGNFGTVAAGRLTTPQDSILGKVDPFGSSAVTGYGLTWTNGASTAGNDITRLDNTVAYITPSYSGLVTTVAYSNGATGNEGPDNQRTVFAIAPTYTNGPVFVGLNYHRADVRDGSALDGANEQVWDLAGTYDFGVAKLHAAYGQDKTEVSGTTVSKVKQWFIGATAPVSAAGMVQVVYGQQKDSEVDNSTTKRWALGYQHSLSKRTTAYAQYGNISYDDNSFDGYSSQYERAFGLGISHTF
ncbi:porin [Azoarcus sp. L1K30]|uniref:porin n=1 Tax=Azoarcus sp. L1K30 TaxID=2820277 RepID=UPI001B836F17|nr:porin [Azoarcus sp. L1K30]MBR0566776.1 porin [Azoarcus sp. L1K30]